MNDKEMALVEQLPPAHSRKQVHKLFSVMGWKFEGHTVELIIAGSEANAEDYALRELGFVKVDSSSLASDSVHIGLADAEK